MATDSSRDQALYHALKAVDEVAAALQAHLIEDHGVSPEALASTNTASHPLTLLRQARERLGEGLRGINADRLADTDPISLRPQRDSSATQA